MLKTLSFPWRSRTSIHQRKTRNDDLELQEPLTAKCTKKDDTIHTTHELQPSQSKKSPVQHASSFGVKRFLGPRFQGWRSGVLNFAVLSSIVFVINLTATIWGLATTTEEKGVFFEGACDRVKMSNTALHLLINVFGTVLLAGSNYCMQCMSAPTRSEIDFCHGLTPGVFLDIGVPSIRNLFKISGRRVVLWCLLGLSSLPLHLLYNSAVFGSFSSNSYDVYLVSESLIKDSECTECRPKRGLRELPTQLLETLHRGPQAEPLVKLDPAKCINEYATSIQFKRRNLLLVAQDGVPPLEDNSFINGSGFYWGASITAADWLEVEWSYGWICSGLGFDIDDYDYSIRKCSTDFKLINPTEIDPWRVGRNCDQSDSAWCDFTARPVEYCLSEVAEQRCRLSFEPSIAIIVTILNFIKAILMFYIAFFIRDEPLMTMGDAVASFLDNADPTTQNMCLSTCKDFADTRSCKVGQRQWTDTRYLWKDVTTKTRRIFTVIMYKRFLVALAAVGYLLSMGINNLTGDESIFGLGLGRVDPATTIEGLPSALVSVVIIANTPQLVLSILYFSFNALFTAMLMGYEWVSYSQKRKGLRVSHQPSGAQRYTYFLQLPYRFGIPIMILSSILHWLVSQSLFLVAIDYYNNDGTPTMRDFDEFDTPGTPANILTLGYSPLAIIFVIVLGSFMVIGIVAFGYIPYRRGMPIAGSCSMAISAACQSIERYEDDEFRLSEQELQWGVVRIGAQGVGHCTFSMSEVETPVKGKLYAGFIKWRGL